MRVTQVAFMVCWLHVALQFSPVEILGRNLLVLLPDGDCWAVAASMLRTADQMLMVQMIVLIGSIR